MKKFLLLVVISLLCFSMFSTLASEVKATGTFNVLWRAPTKDVYWEWIGPGGPVPGALSVDTGDVEGDGIPEVAAIAYDWNYGNVATNHTLQIFKSDGTELWSVSINIMGAHVAIADVDGDGEGEVFAFGTTEDTGNSNAVIYAFDHDGIFLWKNLDTSDNGFWARFPRWIAFTNIDADPQLELIVSNGGYLNQHTYALDTDGHLLWSFTGNGAQHMLFGDVTGDGIEEVIVLTHVGHTIYVLDKFDGSLLWSYSTINYNQGALVDLNGDGINDIVVNSGAQDIYPPNNELYAIRNDGTPLWSQGLAYGGSNSPTVPVPEDINHDGYKDVVVGAEQRIEAYYNNGTLAWTFGDPTYFNSQTPQVYRFDINRDNQDEMIFFKDKDVYQLFDNGTAELFGTLPLSDSWQIESALHTFGSRVTEMMSTQSAWLSSADINNDGFDELLAYEIIDGKFYLTVIATTPTSPVLYQLTVTSMPLTRIPFTINAVSKTTPYTESLPEGYYTIEMPQTYNGYKWSKWLEDGDTSRTKTIYLHGTTWTGVYVLITPPVGGEWVPITMQTLTPSYTRQILVLSISLISLMILLATSFVYIRRKRRLG